MNERHHILIVEDEPLPGKVIHDTLLQKGYQVSLFERAEEALAFFSRHAIHLALIDYKLPGMSGEAFYLKMKEQNPMVPVVFMTAYSSVEKAVQLLKLGAYSYLNKPLEMDELLHTIELALEKVTLVAENRRLSEDLRARFSVENYVFSSERMQQVMSLVTRAADSHSTILIGGESGTGKEVIANILHHASSRSAKALVKVNLAALPATLIEAELFGSMKGAYTGANENRIGKFEEASGGTLFLDEVGELPLETQVKLLRVIQEREINRLGSNRTIQVDIRLITATNRDLQQMVKEKLFREDLFFRLNVIHIELPPLRDRRDEIPLLIDLFIKKYSQREGKPIRQISHEALDTLIKYDFPGNIRELENIIERAVVLCRGEVLSRSDLPLHLFAQKEEGQIGIWLESPLPLNERLQEIEKTIINHTLTKHHHHQSKTAQELGISESGLRYKLNSLGIKT